jgi:ribosomal protein S21
MDRKPGESFEELMQRFNRATQGVVEEAVNRQRFVSNTRRRRQREAAARKRWRKKRAWLEYQAWRSDKYDGGA